ncbi:hypothetical protein J2X88_004855 [Pseudomonas extremaustralis]|jgi:hypothetical protein|nr:hypothetical protein [Pseudomonas extremaustralis]
MSSVIIKGLDKAAFERISDKPECASVPISSNGPMVGGFPGGSFIVSGSAVVSFLITSNGVKFGLGVFSDPNSLGDGSYRFLFADGSQSSELKCKEYKSHASCDDKTSDDGAKEVYGELQKNLS